MYKNEVITVEDFETYIGIGVTMEELKTIFLMSDADMDEWCHKEYNLDFKTVYKVISLTAVAEYKACLHRLAMSGNATAINSINAWVYNAGQTLDAKVTVCSDVPKEEPEHVDM